MFEIIIYAFGIMYTPGPVNLLSLHSGLHGKISTALQFCMGVACAMLISFLLFGYTGAWLIQAEYQLIISAFGCSYIFYLAVKIFRAGSPIKEKEAEVSNSEKDTAGHQAGFQTGLLMQLFNPKGFIAILPIVSVQFPAAGITGSDILLWSAFLSLMASGAPGSYFLMGARMGKWIKKPGYFQWMNRIMSLLLIYVASDITMNHIVLPLTDIL